MKCEELGQGYAPITKLNGSRGPTENFFLVAVVEWLCRALMVRNKQSNQQEGGRIEEIVWIQLVFPYELRNQREN